MISAILKFQARKLYRIPVIPKGGFFKFYAQYGLFCCFQELQLVVIDNGHIFRREDLRFMHSFTTTSTNLVHECTSRLLGV